MGDPAEKLEAWGAFDPGNVGSYPGRVEKVVPGDVDHEILDLRATDDRGVTLVTLMLSVTPAGDINTLRAPFCSISWGVSGGRDRVVIDWLHGQSVTLASTFVRVSATFPLPDNLNPPGFPPGPIDAEAFGNPTPNIPTGNSTSEREALFLGLNAAPFASSFSRPPTLTTFHTVPAAEAGVDGVSDFIPIPSHAKSVTILGNLAPGDISLISAFTIPVPLANLYSTTNPTNNLEQFAFPIGRGVEFVQLSNHTAADIFLQLLWAIGL